MYVSMIDKQYTNEFTVNTKLVGPPLQTFDSSID